MDQNATTSDRPGELLKLFYPIQYEIGLALEDALRVDQLSRKQVVILWLIRHKGENGHWMNRKDIEAMLSSWFEISSSTITKALRAMSRPPLGLVKVLEDPHSGRQKKIMLTAKGARFIEEMVERGRAFIQPVVAQMSEEEAEAGLNFLRKWVSIAENLSIAILLKNASAAGRKPSASSSAVSLAVAVQESE